MKCLKEKSVSNHKNIHLLFIAVPATNVKARLLTEEEGCGIPKLQSTLNFRIVGGTRATRGTDQIKNMTSKL